MKINSRAIFIVSYFIFCYCPIVLAFENPVFSHIFSKDGLSQDYVTAIEQDKHGFIWIGTQEGLNRWDGLKFENFLHIIADTTSISSDYISDLLSTKDGELWVATQGGGINIYNRKNRNFRVFNGFNNDEISGVTHIRVLHQSKDGMIWVGTENNGIYLLDVYNQSIDHLFPGSDPGSLSSNNIRDIQSDELGRTWIATEGGGVNMWDSEIGRFVHYRHETENVNSISSDKILSLRPMLDGTVWAGTYDKGLAIINPFQRKIVRLEHKVDDYFSLADNRIRTIFQDSDGRIWIGTDAGLELWNSDYRGFHHFYHDQSSRHSLSDNRVSCITQDNGGVLWIGTFSGVNKWNARLGSVEHIKKDTKAPSSLSSNIITSFADSSDGALWIGTWGGGLNGFNARDGQFVQYMPSDGENSISDSRVMSLLVDSKERLLVGTRGGGLNVKYPDTKNFITFRHDPDNQQSISNNGVTRLFEDSNNNIWVATIGGVNLFDDSGFKQFNHDPNDINSLGSDRVVDISEGPKGFIWFATDGGGVSYYSLHDKQMHRLPLIKDTHNREINESFISVLATEELLWLGSKDSGLLKVEFNTQEGGAKIVTHFSRQNGLPSNVIFGILEDDSGMIWVSSNKGVSAIAPESGRVRNFGINHGLQGAEFNSGAYHKANDGSLYFGGNNGFNRFNPRHLLLSVNQHQPNIVITNLSVLNRPLQLSTALADVKSIDLDYFQNFLSFEFASLDFTTPQKNKYQFRMLGLQEQWSIPNPRNQANYTNLQPGKYTFEVRGTNNAGIWSKSRFLDLSIKPPPWRSLPAYILYLLIVILLILFIFNWMKQSASKLIEAETNQKLKMYLSCLNEASDNVAIIDEDGHYIYKNKSFENLIENTNPLKNKQTIQQTLLTEPGKSEIALAKIQEHNHWQGQIEHYKKHNQIVLDLGLTKVDHNFDQSSPIIVVAHDVTSIKQSEAELKRYRNRLEALVYKRTQELEQQIKKQRKSEDELTLSLKEKEMLLKEVHHRVKNNMQVISSLLNMQSASAENPEYTMLLSESQNRIRSMALIHESLYQSDNFLEIDFNDYIHLLVGTLSRVYSSSTYGIEIQISAEDVFLDIDTAVPCGLIINELVSNAYKHAFVKPETKGKVFIEMSSNEEKYILKVKDNGVGFPKDVDFRKTTSLGMEIVCILIQQITGTIELVKEGGSTFIIEFPKKDPGMKK